MEKKLRKAVSVLIVKHSDEFTSGCGVLLLKHVKCKGLWMMPCGKVDPIDGDNIGNIIKRELDEELGFKPTNPAYLLFRRDSFYERIDKDETFDESVFSIEYNGEDYHNAEPDKAEDLKWFDIMDVMTKDLFSENTVIACRIIFSNDVVEKSEEVEFKVKKLTNTANLPQRAHSTDSGLDLFTDEDTFTIWPNDRKLVKTGIAIALPYGYEAQVRPKSGLALKQGLTVLNTPGTIDLNFRGEIGVILFNTNKEPVRVERGQKIAQLVITPVSYMNYKVVDELDDTDRGEGGFGSTGVK